MPAVNSKIMRKAMEVANTTARQLARHDLDEARRTEHLLLELRSQLRLRHGAGEMQGAAEPGAAGAAQGVDEVARQLAIVERWGCLDSTRWGPALGPVE